MLKIHQFIKGQSFDKNDEYSDVDELSKAVLLSGLNSFLSVRASVKTHGKLTVANDLFTE